MSIKSIIGVALLITLSSSLHATVYTHGALSSDDTTNYITNANSGRQYTRFDAFDLSYADTLSAVGAGGSWQGWSIATADVATDFISAILNTTAHSCTSASTTMVLCGYIPSWDYNVDLVDHDGEFGNSFSLLDNDYFAFINATDTNNPIGVVNLEWTGNIFKDDVWGDISLLDSHTGNNLPVNLLLYKDAPEPSIVLLLASGLILIGITRRKIQL